MPHVCHYQSKLGQWKSESIAAYSNERSKRKQYASSNYSQEIWRSKKFSVVDIN
jgi:hypothetical protein